MFFLSSHHCSWYKIPIPLRSRIYRVVHVFPKHLWVVIPLSCQVKTAVVSLSSAWHFFRYEAVWVEVMLLLGVLQASKVTSVISILRIKLYKFFGYFVFSFPDHIVVFWLLFWFFLLLFILCIFFLCRLYKNSFLSPSISGACSIGLEVEQMEFLIKGTGETNWLTSHIVVRV